ncbi:MAG TPA: helix-turn-helix transcriptional regulator [Allosphingosinicella sp.]|nr:helix-turn-helix transcriptional regulator [Allosphingosinicella sp.]
MGKQDKDRNRGNRLRQAMAMRGYGKATALAAGLDISPAAITKWTQGHAMSIGHVCSLARLLDISLDWFLMGRNGVDWLRPDQLSDVEINLLGQLRERPSRIGQILSRLINEIPKISSSDPTNIP